MGDPRDRQEQAPHTPYDIDVEQAILGVCMRDPAQIDVACADINGDHFYDPLHARMFDMMVALHGDGDAPTPLVLHSVMKADAGLIETGGMAYLEALLGAAPSIVTMRQWVRTILDLHLRRQLQGIAADLAAGAIAPPEEATGQQVADRVTEALLLAGRASAKPTQTIREIAMETLKEIEDVKAGKPVPLVKTGLTKVDQEYGGLRGGDFVVVAAKSGMGKSALLGTIAMNAARAGVPVIFFSLEMTRRQLVDRMMCDFDFDTAEKPMWYSRFRNHRMSDDEFARYMLASQKTDDWPIEIVDEAALTMPQISARARAFKAKHGNRLGLVIGDYLQKVEPTNYQDNRERQVNKIASAAKDNAKNMGWPWVWGSQFNEDDKNRSANEKRPQPGDVRESKGILHEADMMFSPWRPAYFVGLRKPMDATPGDIAWNTWAGELRDVIHRFDLLCMKNRHGRIQDIELYCEIGASAIRDEQPMHLRPVHEQASADLLSNV